MQEHFPSPSIGKIDGSSPGSASRPGRARLRGLETIVQLLLELGEIDGLPNAKGLVIVDDEPSVSE